MGLSDNERLIGLYESITQLTAIVHDWRQSCRTRDMGCEYRRICKLADALWPALFANPDEVKCWAAYDLIPDEPQALWPIAISRHLWHDNPSCGNNRMFNALKTVDIPCLLCRDYEVETENGVCHSYVFRLYEALEGLFYYLCRYDDGFLKKYQKLFDAAARLYGECYRVFSQNQTFAKAYVVHGIMRILYGEGYPYEANPDVVTRILDKLNLHFSLAQLMTWPLETLTSHYASLVRAQAKVIAGEDKDAMDELNRVRLMTTVQCAQTLHEFGHLRRDLIKMLEQSPMAHYVGEIRGMFEKLAAEHAQQKTEEISRKRRAEAQQMIDNCDSWRHTTTD